MLGNTTNTTSALANTGGLYVSNSSAAAGSITGRLRLDSSNQTNTSPSASINDGASMAPVLVVGKLGKSDSQGNYNSLWAWVNPTSTEENLNGVLGGGAITRDIGINNVDRFYFFGGDSLSGSTDTFAVDNIRIGTTYADVISVIPEPGTALAGLLLAAGLLRRRRD